MAPSRGPFFYGLTCNRLVAYYPSAPLPKFVRYRGIP